MATDLERLVVSLSADLKQYEKAWAKAQGVTTTNLRKMEKDAMAGATRIEKSMGRVGSALTGFGKGLVIGGVLAAVAGFEQLVVGSISSAAAIGDLSDKLGITSDKLQELQFGAVQANMDFETLEKSLLKFSKALGQAQNGQGDLLKTLEANGFDKAKIKALSYSEALDVVADLIAHAKNEQDALLIVTQAFGKGGDDMLEFLRQGSAGLKQFAIEAQRAGTVIDEELIRAGQRFDDAWSVALLHVKKGLGDFVLETISSTEKLWNSLANPPTNTIEAMRWLKTGSATPTTPAAIPQTVNTTGKGGFQGATKIFDPEVAQAAEQKAKVLAKAAADQAEAIRKVIEALQFEGEQLTRSDLQQQINTELRKAGVTATSEQGKAIAALVTRNFELQASQDAAIDAGEAYLEAQEEINASLMELAQIGFDAFEAIAIGGEKAIDVIKDLAMQMLKAAVAASLFGSGPFASLFGTASSGGIFGSLFNTPKLYAKGGMIGPGEVGIAGERGAELIQGPANVIPLNRLGGGANVQVNVMNFGNDNVDVRRSNGPNGLKFDVIVGQMVNNHIGKGLANSVMKGTFGIGPTKTRR